MISHHSSFPLQRTPLPSRELGVRDPPPRLVERWKTKTDIERDLRGGAREEPGRDGGWGAAEDVEASTGGVEGGAKGRGLGGVECTAALVGVEGSVAGVGGGGSERERRRR
jgi:hypothetical protein